MAKTTNTISEEFKEAVNKACTSLSSYQRLLESKGKATEATRIKAIKDDLWEQCQKHLNP